MSDKIRAFEHIMFSRLFVLSLLLGSSLLAAGPAKAPPPAQVKGNPKPASAAQPKPVAYDDPAKTDADFPIQGEYVGKMRDADFALQISAQGGGQFDAVMCPGGLPGAGWTKQPNPRQRVPGKLAADAVRFAGNGWTGTLHGGVVALKDFKGGAIGELKRIERKSPTLGAPPPAGAVVLFDGKDTSAFKDGAKMTADKLLMQGCTSKGEFGDCTIHIEFRTPYMPTARSQARGNSGIYLASRYEVQMLDSFGLTGENNECGGIYTVAKPQTNMCLPPLSWQTYDIEFKTPRFDDKGMKTEDAEITVNHNGVLIHDGVKVSGPTRAAPLSKEGPTGPIYLQDHGTPVRYRNIWVMKK
jgi:hypothetical protein